MPLSSRYERLKHLLKVFRDLFERPLDRFVFPLIKRLDELLDRFGRRVELSSPFEQFVSLFGEVVVLLKRLLVDVGEFLEAVVDLVQLLYELRRISQCMCVFPGIDSLCLPEYPYIWNMPLLARPPNLEWHCCTLPSC